MKSPFSCTLKAISRGSLCRGINQFSTYSPLIKIYFTPIKGAKAWTLMPLSYASDSDGAARICQRGGGGEQSEGAKQPRGGGEGRVCVWGGGVPPFTVYPPPTVGRF